MAADEEVHRHQQFRRLHFEVQALQLLVHDVERFDQSASVVYLVD